MQNFRHKTTTLIADSGSTKTKWAMACDECENGNESVTKETHESVTKETPQSFVTSGLNPALQTPAEIEAILRRDLPSPPEGVTRVRFYGAGCLPDLCEGVADVLRRLFSTGDVTVGSDLLGAARGVLGTRAGVVAILGTGCNSALWDGKRIICNTPPLGYILGDEGSGADLGKRLISALLKNLLPDDLAEAFRRTHPLSYSEIIESVYRRPAANRFLASFAPFLHEHLAHPAARAIVEDSFSSFITRNLSQYDTPAVSFVGSVAHHFEEPLRATAARHGLRVDTIVQSPMPGLIRYHS